MHHAALLSAKKRANLIKYYKENTFLTLYWLYIFNFLTIIISKFSNLDYLA